MSTYIAVVAGLLLVAALSWIDACQKREPRGASLKERFSYPTGNELGLYLLFEKLPKLTVFRRHVNKGDGIRSPEDADESQRYSLQLGMIPTALLVGLGIPFAASLILSLVEGTTILSGGNKGLLEDPGFMSLLIVTPLLIYLFHRVVEAIPDAFQAVASRSASEAEDHLDAAARVVFQAGKRSRGWMGLEIGLGIVLAILVAVHQSWKVGDHSATTFWSDPTYPGANTVLVIYVCISVVYLFRIGVMQIVRLLWAMRQLGKALEKDKLLHVEPLHPDNAGGLLAFGRLAWHIDLILLPLVLLIPFWRVTMRDDIFWWSLTIFCVVAIPTFFLVPLWGIHQAMAAAKKEKLAPLSTQFNENIPIMQEWLANEEVSPSSEALPVRETLGCIVMIHERVSRMPVWPFNIAIVAQVGVYFITPVVMLAVQLTRS